MPAPTHPLITPPRPYTRTGERGFGMVEMLVVMVIVLILAGVAMMSLRSVKGSAFSKEAIAAGAAYSDAITKFQADHANNNPAAGDMTTLQGKPAGPKSLLDPTKPYLAPVPDAVLAGRVFADMGGLNCSAAPSGAGAPANANGIVSYCPAAAPNWSIRVTAKPKVGDTWANAKVCWLGNAGRTPSCNT